MGALQARLVFFAFVGLSAAISYNAIFLQKGRHPAPITVEAGKSSGGNGARSAVVPPPVQKDSITSSTEPSSGSDTVRAIQRELTAKGYDPGEVDGVAGVLTRAAIMAYQFDKKLPVTGVGSTELLEHIVLGGPGKAGSPAQDAEVPPETTEIIKGVQQILNQLGYTPGPVDGVLGAGTEQAIRSFERERNMQVTGRISGKLLKEMMRVTGFKTQASPSG
jgi:peptidoglycan hydrolase-like protein with peptidoglycan-binding domain